VIGPFLSMKVLCGLARRSNDRHNWRPDGAIRGNGRILNVKENEWSDLKFRASRW
jgi:hypothetical protein